MLDGIWLALLGVLGAANLIIARKPDAAEAIAKIAPYQGWIGAVSAIWGLWGVVRSLLNLGVLGAAPILWVTWFAVGLVQLCLGLLLGIGVIKTFVKQPTAVERMNQMVTRLAPKQGVLGLAAIGLGVWMVVAGVLFSVA